MNINKIQARLDAMTARMSAKGLNQPEAQFQATGNVQPKGWLVWWDRSAPSYASSKYEWFHGDSAENILDEMDAWIAALPSAEEVKRGEFLRALSNVIELGKDNGISVDYVNPLVETMKRLSENALTDQREVA